MSDGTSSGEINVLILARITEVAGKVEAVANGQADLKTSMMVQFNDGKHRMDGLEQRIEGLEKKEAPKSDEESDWSRQAPRSHHKMSRPQREAPTEPIAKKSIDMALLIKYGAVIGAAAAGAWAAVRGSP